MAQLDWVAHARGVVNADPSYRRLGTTDLVLGLKSGKAVQIVTFEAFEVATAELSDEASLRDCEVVIEMTPRQWTNYLQRRARGTGPSLVSVDLNRGIVAAPDPVRRLKFERYHLSVQALVDAGARSQGEHRQRAAAS